MNAFFKFNTNSKGHPYILSDALPRDYFDQHFNGKLLPLSWAPPKVDLVRPRAKLADFMCWKESLTLLSQRAVTLFEKFASGCAEYKFFFEIRKQPYYILNVLTQEDIFDHARSGFTLTEDGRIRTVQTFAFTRLDATPPLFKLVGFPRGPNFVTFEFARTIVDAQLLGHEFRDPAVDEMSMLFAGESASAFP